MPVAIIIKRVLDERGMNISQFAKATGLAYPTAHSLYHGTSRRVELETLATLCRKLDITINDILEYTPDEA